MTGSLHIGHALDHTYQDYLASLHRMRGYEVLWLPGMDRRHRHPERGRARARQGGQDPLRPGPEAFVERVWAWKASPAGILGQMQRLGDSVDWSRERFTMDEGLSRAVREVFVSLYEQGSLPGPADHQLVPPLPDRPVRHRGRARGGPGRAGHLRYPLADGSGFIEVATSRAETMLGDTAVAVHPDDPRYRPGRQTVRCPWSTGSSRSWPTRPSDREFGTGAVKVTPAHDPNDHEIAERHGLPAVDILTEEAIVNAEGGRFEGWTATPPAARSRPPWPSWGCWSGSRRSPLGRPLLPLPHRGRAAAVAAVVRGHQAAGRAGHGGGPLRADPVRAGPLREDLLRLDGADPRLVRVPPALVGPPHPRLVLPGRPRHRGPPGPGRLRHLRRGELAQDEDVLDTWFSSGLWPFSTLGWPDRGPGRLLPDLGAGHRLRHHLLLGGPDADVRLPLQPPTPFEVVAIHGMVRDAQGKKMSKSFGNVIDPIELMDRYGTDALRFALIRGPTRATCPWPRSGSRRPHFANKLWNLGRFVMIGGGARPDPHRAVPGGRVRPSPAGSAPTGGSCPVWSEPGPR